MTEQETLWLKAYALGLSTSQVLARREFSPEETAKINSVIARREAGEPLQYIMGEADFWGRDFHVGQGVLIPRHDTETLIQAVLKLFPHDEKFSFIDWGTGSGCIAITLLLEFPRSFAYMIDTERSAYRFAEFNIKRYDLIYRSELLLWDAFLPKCDLLISNPPYIPSAEIAGLSKDVRDYEPISALDGGEDGLKFYNEIFALAMKTHCRYLILETGNANQVQSLKASCSHYEFTFCDNVCDDTGFPRCLVFRRSDVNEKVEETCG